jgi:hypothetical protein
MNKKKYNTIEEDTSIVGMFKVLYNRARTQPLVFFMEVFTVAALFGLLYIGLWFGAILGLQ